jgi:hypothetical protein
MDQSGRHQRISTVSSEGDAADAFMVRVTDLDPVTPAEMTVEYSFRRERSLFMCTATI